MLNYALYYQQKATFLGLDDARVWIDICNLYDNEKLQMLDQAMKYYIQDLRNIHLGYHDEATLYYITK